MQRLPRTWEATAPPPWHLRGPSKRVCVVVAVVKVAEDGRKCRQAALWHGFYTELSTAANACLLVARQGHAATRKLHCHGAVTAEPRCSDLHHKGDLFLYLFCVAKTQSRRVC